MSPEPGTRIEVFSADQSESLGFGVLAEWVDLGGGLMTPRIVFDDGTELHGYECWWHPAP